MLIFMGRQERQPYLFSQIYQRLRLLGEKLFRHLLNIENLNISVIYLAILGIFSLFIKI
ncbi:MAG: hypothetical protein KME19_15855 [Microcoleus vaginatus WJT46-NPBG5]|nr:hypothetical protein [Microcoleus vaginatus WJT46-NPBG5]